MKQQKNNTARILLVVGIILLIPFFGSIFIEGWNWGVFDFVVAFVLLFGTGLALDFVSQKKFKTLYKFATMAAILFVLLLFWAELATDAVSQFLSVLL